MKFGITYNSAHLGTDPARIASFARRAEDAGFESFYVPEHLVLYPGASVGSFELPPALPVADPVDL
ncbi:MAG: LLM class F420-dependent oxidoreductase, partial [Nonomuraea sp.]|nr:LLM class F420-dependent oxidoreductase [Nonomuraea sp.]